MLMHNPPHPGEVIQGLFIEPNEWTLTNVANALEVSPGNFSRLVNGKISLSSDMAVRLSRVLGLEPLTWMRMQADHDICNAQQENDIWNAQQENDIWNAQQENDIWNAQQENDHPELKRFAVKV